MPFNVSNFKTNIKYDGYLQTNKFSMHLLSPPVLVDSYPNNWLKTTSFRIDNVITPGNMLMSFDVNRYGVGPTQKHPWNAQIQEILCSIICDKKGKIWQFWHDWSNAIFQFTGVTNLDALYVTEYKDNYATTIDINIYDSVGELVKTITLHQAFPISIKEIALDWNDNDNLVKITPIISFKEYTTS